MPLNESIEIFRESGKKIDTITSIDGGVKILLGFKFKQISLMQ